MDTLAQDREHFKLNTSLVHSGGTSFESRSGNRTR
jgi:hypothetical protein